MKIPVRLKVGHTIPQPTAQPWTRGDVVQFVRAADDRAYAVVLTEHGEFEFVPHYGLRFCGIDQGRRSAWDGNEK